jgi:hypothetical protein
VFRNKLNKFSICCLTRACTNQRSVLKAREISAFCGDMFTTERQTTQHAESLPQRIGPSWTYRYRIVFGVRAPVWNKGLSGIVT